jgi:hypothetical protein
MTAMPTNLSKSILESHVYMKGKFVFILITSYLILAGCAAATTQGRLLDSEPGQVQLKSIQTRVFDTTDKEKTLKMVMSTLKDLGFVIDRADAALGSVSATKTKKYADLHMTVTLRERGEDQLLVSARAQYNVRPVTDPEPYHHFFTSLEKAMFLTAHQID